MGPNCGHSPSAFTAAGCIRCLDERIRSITTCDPRLASEILASQIIELEHERDSLKADLERAREALDGLATVADVLVREGSVRGPLSLQGWINKARAALACKEEKEGAA